jgi:glycosyltransferase involved in cell wall biosynthesis
LLTKRFGTVFPFLESGRQPRQLGRLVANADFTKALLKYGTFDEYVFSNTSTSNLRIFSEILRQWELPAERLSTVRYVDYVALPAVLTREAFHVFHLGGWGAFMPGLHYVRARHASNAWPITAVTHSLNGRDVVDHAVRVSHAGMAPYDAIFCTSRDGREAVHRLLAAGAKIAGSPFAGRLEHLPLGIDDDILDHPGDRTRARARLRIQPDAVVLLVLGRMTPFQKMDLAPVLRTFARGVLPRTARPTCLLLAGSASPDDLRLVTGAIERYGIASHVRLNANFKAEQKADVLAAADILLSPVDNTQETFGLSILEAMAASLAVVASRFDGYKDLVDDGVDGFLIDTVSSPVDPMNDWFDLLDADIAQLFQSQGVAVDTDQLAARLLALIDDEGLRERIAKAGRAKVACDYRWSRVIARYEAAWNLLASEAARTGIVRPRAPRNPFDIGPQTVFPHYSSHTLDPSRRVIATSTTIDDSPYNETAIVLTPALLARLLRLAQRETSVGDLVRSADAPEGHAAYAVVWLLKYGLLMFS